MYRCHLIYILHLLGEESNSSQSKNNQRVYDHQLVRTDSREQTLHAFVKPSTSSTRETRYAIYTHLQKKFIYIYIIHSVYVYCRQFMCFSLFCSGEPSASLKQFGLKPDNGSEKCQSIEINDEETDMEVDSNATTGKRK